MKTYYKVVRNRNGALESVFADDEALISYVPNKWISAPKWLRDQGKGPFVFDTLENARSWMGIVFIISYSLSIWECQVRKISTPAYCTLWRLNQGCIEVNKWEEFPKGTLQVDQVKLIRMIE